MKIPACIALLTVFAAVSPGYYHYVHYTSRTSPYVPVVEKFDINVLPNKTLPYFISQQHDGAQFAPTDSFASVVSEIRAAAQIWSDVETSDLRLGFGGLNDGDSGNGYPSIQVVLGDVPPGLVAATTRPPAGDFNGQFAPVTKAIIVLRQDLRDRPSYSDAFFTTVVHEFGHALGLQHTFTGSVMSTFTRATGRSKPLTADDVAGISLLYPSATKNVFAKTGTITGRVTMGGQGVHMATVVALPVDGSAVSTVTNPDGTYRIDGLLSNEYYVYAAPLPPAQQSQGETSPGNIVFPIDANGKPLGPTGSFDTVFYPGTRSPQQKVGVSAGNISGGVDFSVRARSAPAIYSVSTFSYPNGSFGVKPAYLNPTMQYPMVVADGTGLTTSSGVIGGFTVSQIGGGPLPVRTYPGYPKWAIIDVDPSTLTGSPDGPRHLLFTSANDIYVLPAAYWQVQDPPPSLTSISSVGDGARTIAITGTTLRSSTRVQFDGVTAVSKGLDDGGRLLVQAPQASFAAKANIIAVNPDGQSSAFMQDPAPTFTYENDLASTSNSGTISPSTAPASSVVKVDITATNGNFVDGLVWVGFGTSDIVVHHVWVIDSNTARANITILPGANIGLVQPTVVSGLQTLQVAAFEITPATSRAVSLLMPASNYATGAAYVYPGATVSVSITNAISAVGSGTVLTLDNKSIPFSQFGNQIVFQVPASQPVGPSVLRLDTATDRGNPAVLFLDAAPPQITSVTNTNGDAIDGGHPAHPGDAIVLQVSGLGDPNATINPARVSVNIAGRDVAPSQITSANGNFKVTVTVPGNFNPTASTAPLTISVDGHTSAVYSVSVR